MQTRSVDHPADLPAIRRFIGRCEQALGRPPLSEHKHRSLFGSDLRGGGLLVHEGDRLIGYAHILASHRRGTFELEMVVDPQLIGSLEEDLVLAARESANSSGAESLIVWDYGGLELDRVPGLVPDRRLHELRAGLPVEPPRDVPGMPIRSYRPEDEAALLYVTNAAFGDHPEAGNWTARDLHEVQGYPWFDVEGIRTVWQGQRLAGFCWTKVHDGGLGEIYLIAIDPQFQGIGLGRRIALEGLRYLYEQRGTRQGMLYVDAANHSALALYKSLGFEVHHTSYSYVVSLG